MGGKRKRGNSRKRQEKQQVVVEEEEDEQQQATSEDYCFICKDGGLLIVCDHKDCVKAYHLECVGKNEDNDDEEEKWICEWHFCLVCKKSPKYQCYCCPNAVCQRCYKDAVFARVRGNKGFCHDCLRLALLGEEGLDVDSDGEKVDFKDRETYEGLFKEYWDIIKEKEGLTLEDLQNADVVIKKGENYTPHSRKSNFDSLSAKKSNSDSEEYVNKEEEEELKGSSSDDVITQPMVEKYKKKPKKAQPKRKGSKRVEFLGWASKSLTEFLVSIGVDASKKLSQEDVASLVTKYVQENKLFNPEKKKVVLCDARLRSLFGRKSFNVYKINDALEPHFAENLEQSEDEGYSSGCEEEDNASLAPKKELWWRKIGMSAFTNKGSIMEKFQQNEAISEEPLKKDAGVKIVYSEFATVIPKNMKIVYLRRSLVEKLLEDQETFERKVVGSFVKVKSNPFDSKHPHHLLPVIGVKNTGDENNKKILLRVCSLPNDIPISSLSNDNDISQEDCENLRQKVEDGIVERPTVAQLEEKAKCLHEDITKHWITRELCILRNRIDLANEKGRRAEYPLFCVIILTLISYWKLLNCTYCLSLNSKVLWLLYLNLSLTHFSVSTLYEYRKRRELLQSEEEQDRLLNQVPKVIADIIEINPEEPQPDHITDENPDPVEELNQKKVLPDQFF